MKFWPFFLVLLIFVLVIVSTWPARRQFLAKSKEKDYDFRLASQEQHSGSVYEYLKNLAASREKILDAEEHLATILAFEHQYEVVNSLYRQIWRERLKMSPKDKYDPKLVKLLLSMAFLDLDLGDLKASENCYETIWEYDKKWLMTNDARLTRDLNNLGVVHYLLALSATDKLKRQLQFESSNSFLLQSLSSSRQDKSDLEREANILDNQYLALRDTDRLNLAEAAKTEAQKLHLLIPGRFNAP